ncbi:hypothetical protein CesoFtcFv8_007062 [Champsocephalus esox]|uniref:Uncharacterized protein n=1 Tax=Champsocephalus esox TaxID=159716 RepID=A0AAN8H4H1_9TELE|nr:hypothetical protein CesoFtcFv8_007062 [Champsocephalus esox]
MSSGGGEMSAQRGYWFQDVSSPYLSPECESDRRQTHGAWAGQRAWGLFNLWSRCVWLQEGVLRESKFMLAFCY